MAGDLATALAAGEPASVSSIPGSNWCNVTAPWKLTNFQDMVNSLKSEMRRCLLEMNTATTAEASARSNDVVRPAMNSNLQGNDSLQHDIADSLRVIARAQAKLAQVSDPTDAL